MAQANFLPENTLSWERLEENSLVIDPCKRAYSFFYIVSETELFTWLKYWLVSEFARRCHEVC